MQAELIAQFEETTGEAFDANGPEVCECEHCGKLLQYIPYHSCYGLHGEEQIARFGGYGVIEE